MDEGALGGLEHYNKERKHAGYSAGGASGIFEDAGEDGTGYSGPRRCKKSKTDIFPLTANWKILLLKNWNPKEIFRYINTSILKKI